MLVAGKDVDSLKLLQEMKAELTKYSFTLDGRTFGPSILDELALKSIHKHFNSGSLGIVCKQALESRIKIIREIESLPDLEMNDLFLNKTDGTKVNQVLAEVAKFVNSDLKNLIFLDNATSGMNIALKSLGLKRGDILLCVSTAYPAISNLINFFVNEIGVEIEILEHNFQFDLISQVETKVKELELRDRKVTVTVIDAISSLPALRLPFEKITHFMQSKGSYVVIDGAHAFNQVELDLNQLKPDYLVTTLHKWGYTNRPTAILYINERLLQSTRPLVTGFGYNTHSIRDQFNWQGTCDFSAWLSTASSLQFIERLGRKQIHSYLKNLNQLASKLIAKVLHTEVPGDHQTNDIFMGNIPLFHPSHKLYQKKELVGINFKIEKILWDTYGFNTRIFIFNDVVYIRISAQIHLDLDDFFSLAMALKQIVHDLDS